MVILQCNLLKSAYRTSENLQVRIHPTVTPLAEVNRFDVSLNKLAVSFRREINKL